MTRSHSKISCESQSVYSDHFFKCKIKYFRSNFCAITTVRFIVKKVDKISRGVFIHRFEITSETRQIGRLGLIDKTKSEFVTSYNF